MEVSLLTQKSEMESSIGLLQNLQF